MSRSQRRARDAAEEKLRLVREKLLSAECRSGHHRCGGGRACTLPGWCKCRCARCVLLREEFPDGAGREEP